MANGETRPPIVFISYSHDSQEHADSVLALSDHLRADGIDCVLDQYEDSPPEGWPRWMDRQIQEADFVIMICTSTYYRGVMGEEEPGTGYGVLWESALIYQYLYNTGTLNTQFIPVLLEGANISDIPTPLQSATYYRLSTATGYEELYRRLTHQHRTLKPALGMLRALPPRERTEDFVENVLEEAHQRHAISEDFLKLFISYRRKSWPIVHLLEEKLKEQIKGEIFVDITGIDDTDFEQSILRHLRESNIVLVVVNELTFSLDRISNDNDWVRREIALALQLNKPIVLILVDNHLPPPSSKLPEDIRDITRKQGIAFYQEYFDAAVQNLTKFVYRVLASISSSKEESSSIPANYNSEPQSSVSHIPLSPTSETNISSVPEIDKYRDSQENFQTSRKDQPKPQSEKNSEYVPSLRDSIVLITSSNPEESSFGTGFIIHRDERGTYVLTCAHVVKDVGGPEKVKARHIPASLVALGSENDIDLAVLCVDGLIDKPLLYLSSSGEAGDKFTTIGFREYGKQHVTVSLEGILEKKVGIGAKEHDEYLEAWSVGITDKDQLQPGNSGSPVVDQGSGQVIAVISHRGDKGETGLAISIKALKEIWHEMPFTLVKEIELDLPSKPKSSKSSEEVPAQSISANLLTTEQKRIDINAISPAFSDIDQYQAHVNVYRDQIAQISQLINFSPQREFVSNYEEVIHVELGIADVIHNLEMLSGNPLGRRFNKSAILGHLNNAHVELNTAVSLAGATDTPTQILGFEHIVKCREPQ